MHAERASSTALLVTALRALASTADAPLIHDGYAARFLPRSWAKAIALTSRRRHAARLLRRLPDAISPGRLQHIALRTRVIDEVLVREAQAGVKELVLLGAGFDTRAYRLTELRGMRLVEIDHPATQQRKRALGRDLRASVREHLFVPLDFERDDLASWLADAPFVTAEPSVFVWEGVTMYLSIDAIRSTLGALASHLAAGSLLVMSYYDSSGASGPPSRMTTALASLLGERFRTRLAPHEAAALVEEFGFAVEHDSGRNDWARAFGQVTLGAAQERVLVARRSNALSG